RMRSVSRWLRHSRICGTSNAVERCASWSDFQRDGSFSRIEFSRGCGVVVACDPSKIEARVRFPPPAQRLSLRFVNQLPGGLRFGLTAASSLRVDRGTGLAESAPTPADSRG